MECGVRAGIHAGTRLHEWTMQLQAAEDVGDGFPFADRESEREKSSGVWRSRLTKAGSYCQNKHL